MRQLFTLPPLELLLSPNPASQMVSLYECLATNEFMTSPSKLTFALGKDEYGRYLYANLAWLPHLLVGGDNPQDVSTCLHIIISSILYRATPREVQFVMIDPKRVELSLYDGIPHLLSPVIKNVKHAAGIFRSVLKEMEDRYDKFARIGTRNLEGYNGRVEPKDRLPFIVVVVDELADLMMQQGPEVETSICRLAQLARASGIHLIITTQRLSTSVFTAAIKSVIFSRIAFSVASEVYSRQIMDASGAEFIVEPNGMFFAPVDAKKPIFIQGCVVTKQEISSIAQYLCEEEEVSYSIIPLEIEKVDVAEGDKSQTVSQKGLSKIENLVGLSNLKFEISQIINFLYVQQMRKEKGLSIPQQSLHMVFTGRPGTGKTTIARLIAQIYKSLGILSQGQFIETDRSGLIAAYLGQTALKVQEVVQSALGGVLFIDEAYSLTEEGAAGGDMYGKEAVNTLLKLMEDHRNNLVVIVAGYTEPMQKFIRSNPGLQSRFNKFLHFDDYAPAELTEIFSRFAAQADYKLTSEAVAKLDGVFERLHAARDETFGNARLARNLFEKSINNHANRMAALANLDEEDLVTLHTEDIATG